MINKREIIIIVVSVVFGLIIGLQVYSYKNVPVHDPQEESTQAITSPNQITVVNSQRETSDKGVLFEDMEKFTGTLNDYRSATLANNEAVIKYQERVSNLVESVEKIKEMCMSNKEILEQVQLKTRGVSAVLGARDCRAGLDLENCEPSDGTIISQLKKNSDSLINSQEILDKSSWKHQSDVIVSEIEKCGDTLRSGHSLLNFLESTRNSIEKIYKPKGYEVTPTEEGTSLLVKINFEIGAEDSDSICSAYTLVAFFPAAKNDKSAKNSGRIPVRTLNSGVCEANITLRETTIASLKDKFSVMLSPIKPFELNLHNN